jgi:hypothetical protein
MKFWPATTVTNSINSTPPGEKFTRTNTKKLRKPCKWGEGGGGYLISKDRKGPLRLGLRLGLGLGLGLGYTLTLTSTSHQLEHLTWFVIASSRLSCVITVGSFRVYATEVFVCMQRKFSCVCNGSFRVYVTGVFVCM